MKLGFLEEIVGTLNEIKEKNGELYLTFIFKKTIEIPKGALPVKELHKNKNKRIGIIYDGEEYFMSTLIGKVNKKDKY